MLFAANCNIFLNETRVLLFYITYLTKVHEFCDRGTCRSSLFLFCPDRLCSRGSTVIALAAELLVSHDPELIGSVLFKLCDLEGSL